MDDPAEIENRAGRAEAIARQVREERLALEQMAAANPDYAVVLAKAAFLNADDVGAGPAPANWRNLIPVTAPAAVVVKYPAAVAAGSIVLGVLLWKSPWSRNALRLAALWGLKNILTRKFGTIF
jgi:hypothetical protein